MVFVSGNMPFKTEIAPVLIVAALEEFDYAEATAIAVVLLADLVRDAGRDQPAGTLEQAPWQLTTHRAAGPRRARSEDPAVGALGADRRRARGRSAS